MRENLYQNLEGNFPRLEPVNLDRMMTLSELKYDEHQDST
jgi:hypothetical protein